MVPALFRLALRRTSLARQSQWLAVRCLSTLPDHKLIHMPALSPTMEVGTIQEWKKKEGDPIEGGDVIAEIETDKATRSYEYNDDGFMAKVRFQTYRTLSFHLLCHTAFANQDHIIISQCNRFSLMKVKQMFLLVS